MTTQVNWTKHIEQVSRPEIEIALGKQAAGRIKPIRLLDHENVKVQVCRTDQPYPALTFELLDTENVEQPQITLIIMMFRKGPNQIAGRGDQSAETGRIGWLMELAQIRHVWDQIEWFEITYLYPSHDS